MKTINHLLFIILLCISNNVIGQVYNYLNYRLISIPTFAHEQPIEVFYENQKPNRPYFNAVILDNSIEHGQGTYADLIIELQQQAQNIGVDALLIYKMGTSTRNRVDAEGYQITISVKEVIAHGIKYKDDLAYLTKIPKEVSIYEVNDSSGKMLQCGSFVQKLNQELIQKTGKIDLYELLKPFSIQHLVFEEKNWQYSLQNNLIYGRQLFNTAGKKIKTAYFDYNKMRKVENIQIKKSRQINNNYDFINQNKAASMRRVNEAFITQEVTIEYNKNGTIHLKRIYPNMKKSNFYYEEIFDYDMIGRLSEKRIFKFDKEKRMELGKFVYNNYYTLEELKEQFAELRN